MANDKSTYLRGKIIEHVLRNVAYASPATVYMSLHTADPGPTGASEVAGNGYARKAVTFGAQSGGVVTNSADVIFDAPTPANWATITHVGIWDALSSGNFIYRGALSVSLVTQIGIPPVVTSGQASFSET